MYSCSLYFGNTRRTRQIFNNFIYAMKREKAEIILIPQKENSVWSGREDIRETVDDIYDLKEDGVKQLMDRLQQLVMSNKQYRNEYCEKEKITDWAQQENVNRWRKYVRQQTKPVVVFIESYMDFALNVDVENAAFLAQYFEMCVGFNVYFIAGFYSDDEEKRNQKMFPNGKADEEEQDEEKERQRAEIQFRDHADELEKEFSIEGAVIPMSFIINNGDQDPAILLNGFGEGYGDTGDHFAVTDEGKVIYTTVQEGYKEGIEWLHKLVRSRSTFPPGSSPAWWICTCICA